MKFRNLFLRYYFPDGDGSGGDGDGDGQGDGDGDGSGDGDGDGDKGGLLSSQRGKNGDGDGDGDGDGKPWNLTEGVAGEGDAPEWFKADKYKTVADQAKALTELEPKLGAAADLIGAPEEDYVMPDMPEGVKGEWDLEDPMLKTWQKVAKELDLSQAAHDKVAAAFAGLLAKETQDAATSTADALAKIGTNASERITAVDNYIASSFGKEAADAIDEAVHTNVDAYLVIEALVSQVSGDAQLANLGGVSGVTFTKEDIEAEQYKVYPEGHPLAGQRMYDHDKEHRKKVDGMWAKLFPGANRTQVG